MKSPQVMKFHFSSLLILIFLFLTVGCNNSAKKKAQQDSDTIKTSTFPNDSIPKRIMPTEQITDDLVKEDQLATGSIANIRIDYQRIQKLVNDGTLRTETTNFECKNDPGSGTLARYYEGGKLVLIDYAVNSEHWWEKKRIYFKNEEAFFIFEQDGNWIFGGPESKTEFQNTIDKVKERRFYLNNGTLLKQLNREFEDKSWEEKTDRNTAPHQTVTLKPNSVYPDAATIPQMKKGNVGC